ARASWIAPKRSGKSGRYLRVLNCASEKGLWWRSGSSAIRLSPPQIRASGFPALGSSRRLPDAGQRDLARVSDSSRRKREASQQRVEPLPRKATLTPPAKHSIPAARDRLVKAAQPRP